jgi:Epoxide hydrolase N terminus
MYVMRPALPLPEPVNRDGLPTLGTPPTFQNPMKNERVSPFRIDLAPELLSDLRQRLKTTRWLYQVKDSSWEAGTDLDYLKELVAYWLDTYDWRQHEADLNRSAHFRTEVDDIGIHLRCEIFLPARR